MPSREPPRGPTLTDTGPLVAIVDPNDGNHVRCWETMRRLPIGGLVTPIPCLVEAMYLLDRAGGYPFQKRLWELAGAGVLKIHTGTAFEYMRAAEIMEIYQNVSRDLADAVVIATAESLRQRTIFTIDGHFYAYRTSDGQSFIVDPGPIRR